MTTLQEIERAIESLPADQLSELAEWFYGFEDRIWQQKLTSGESKLNALADQALEDHRQGKSTEL